MDIKNIENIDFGSLTSEQAAELGINTVFQEKDGTYDWIYCMKMSRNRSMFTFLVKTTTISFALILVVMLFLAGERVAILPVLGIIGLVFVAVMGIVRFSLWLVDKLYKGAYMLIYEMNDQGLTFSQTTDQAQITRTIAAASAAASAAGGNAGGTLAGAGMAVSPNSYYADFSKVRSVKGKRKDNLIWVNTFFQYLMVYVSDEAYDFVWDYITERCVNARIIKGKNNKGE